MTTAQATAAQLQLQLQLELQWAFDFNLLTFSHIHSIYPAYSPNFPSQPPVATAFLPYVLQRVSTSCFGCIYFSFFYFFINGLPFRFYVQLYFSLARYFSLPLLHIWPLDLLPLPLPPASPAAPPPHAFQSR